MNDQNRETKFNCIVQRKIGPIVTKWTNLQSKIDYNSLSFMLFFLRGSILQKVLHMLNCPSL